MPVFTHSRIVPREELETEFLFPVFSYADLQTNELVYVSQGKEIGRLAGGFCNSYVEFLDAELALMRSLRADDWSI